MLSLQLDRQDSRTQHHQEPNEAARSLLAEHQAIAISFFLAIAIDILYDLQYNISEYHMKLEHNGTFNG